MEGGTNGTPAPFCRDRDQRISDAPVTQQPQEAPLHSLHRAIAQQESHQVDSQKATAAQDGHQAIGEQDEGDGEHPIESVDIKVQALEEPDCCPPNQQSQDDSHAHLLHKQQDHSNSAEMYDDLWTAAKILRWWRGIVLFTRLRVGSTHGAGTASD